MPAMIKRPEEITVLLNELIATLEREGRGSVRFNSHAMAVLAKHRWPGNVRELANLVERMEILHPHGIVGVSDLPEKLVASAGSEDALREGVTSAGFAEFAGLNSPGETEVNPAQAALQRLPLPGLVFKEYLARLEREFI